MQEMKAAKLIDEAKLPRRAGAAEGDVNEARNVVADAEQSGEELGLGGQEIGGFIKQMAADRLFR